MAGIAAIADTLESSPSSAKPAARNQAALLSRLAPWAVPVVLIVIWQAAAQAGWLSSRILPEPLAVAKAFWTLAVSGELEAFPLSISDFREIRGPGLAYFDKTRYIPELNKTSKVQLLCRPRRFGKSLTVTMLRYFHGFQFRNLYDKLFKVCTLCARFACTHHLC